MKTNAFLILAAALLAGASGCASSPPLPPKAIEMNEAGAAALASGDLSTAEARLAVAIEYNPRFVEAWVNLGLVELRRGNFEAARRDIKKALHLNPDLPAPHHALGYLDETTGNLDAAEKNYRAALKVDPGFAPARSNLGRLLFKRRAFDDAREQFLRLTEVAPESLEGWTGLAECLLALDRDAEADDALARAVERFGGTPALDLLVARQRLRAARYAEAEELLKPLTTSEDASRRAAAWAWTAMARIGQGDADGAIAAANEALQVDRDQPVATCAMAAAMKARGDRTAALWDAKAKALTESSGY